MYWIQWAEKTFKHSCLMNGWRWLALVGFEVWPFPDRHSRGQGRDNFNPQGLKPELPHDTYTQNGEDWEFLRKKRITFIHFLYSACWCGDCSLKSTLSMWTSWYIFMCNCWWFSLSFEGVSLVTNNQVIQQQHHDASWSGCRWYQNHFYQPWVKTVQHARRLDCKIWGNFSWEKMEDRSGNM